MACFVYEGMLLFGLSLIPGAIGAAFVAQTQQHHPLQSETALRAITFVFYGLYFVWFWSKRGQTLPMQTWQLRLVTVQGGTVSQGRALARYVAAWVWVVPGALLASLNAWTRWQTLMAVGLGMVAYALLTLLHPQRQFWHDALCGTRLVDAPRPSRSGA